MKERTKETCHTMQFNKAKKTIKKKNKKILIK